MKVQCCLGCGSDQFELKGGPGLPVEIMLKDRVFEQPEYRVRHCQTCGLVYKSDVADRETLEDYYEAIDFSKWEADDLYPTERAVVDVLAALPGGSRILDYGCSTGRLLSKLTDKHRCYGVEVNQEAARVAAEKGIEILNAEGGLPGGATEFDAIVLSDVFEHLFEPTRILRGLVRHLRRGGLLVLSTGNADAKACRHDIASFWYFRTPEHLSMMTKSYAAYLAEKLSLNLILWREMCHYTPTLSDKLKQQARHFAYWQFRKNPPSVWRHLLRPIPLLNRAPDWKLPPLFNYSKDHVVMVFKKAQSGAQPETVAAPLRATS
ncbi:MAG TPA: class I SAM-dependent methyltransferase [Pyrinomonadaceae bacterium]